VQTPVGGKKLAAMPVALVEPLVPDPAKVVTSCAWFNNALAKIVIVSVILFMLIILVQKNLNLIGIRNTFFICVLSLFNKFYYFSRI